MSSIKERVTKKCHSDPRVTIDTLHNKIVSELTNEEKTSYYLDNGLLLDSYYSKDINKQRKPTAESSVLSYFQTPEPESEPEIEQTSTIDDYMSNIDDSYVVNNDIIMNDKCKLCGHSMSFGLIDSELICEKCGYTEDIIINSEKTSYKDPPREVSYFAYK